MLNRLSFRAKLTILGMINLMVISALAITAFRSTTDLSGMLNEQAGTSVILRNQMTADMLHDTVNADMLYALNATSGKTTDPGVRSVIFNKFKDDSQKLRKYIALLEEANIGSHTREVLKRLKPDIERYIGAAENVVILAFQDHAVAQAQKPIAMTLFDSLEKGMKELGDTIEAEIKATTLRGDSAGETARRYVVVSSLVGILILILATAYTILSFVKRTETAYGHLKKMAEGNLDVDVRLDVRDEITRILLAVVQLRSKLIADLEESKRADELKKLVGKIQKSVVDVGNAITEIAATSKQQEVTSVEMAATTTQVSATSKEISANSRELVKIMGEVSSVVEHSATLAGGSQAGLLHMTDTMRQMMEAAGSINAKLAVLNDKAGNISQVTTTITKVADQTNLLSLNAAIEAEKAGEYGRGFAIVATEIRRLADQTAVASYDIELMVKEIHSAVSASVMGMDKFSDEVRRGIQEVQHVSGSLSQVIEQVQALSPRFLGVNEGMHAQALGAEQITEALAQLSEASQQTVEALRQSAQAIAYVNQAMHDLSDGVSSHRAE